MNKLPEDFMQKMKRLLGEKEYVEFIDSYKEPVNVALRVNTLKLEVCEFLKIFNYNLKSVPWTKDGFYYNSSELIPGKHPYYHAGLYYIQEASAMFPAEVLSAQPGETVLDLCAAPGGKTTQIAASMKGEGLIVANDVNADRIKALIKNIELCGAKNVVVTNETPDKLAKKFIGYFDKILVDAPCSGEGMFKRDPKATKSWTRFGNERCAVQQKIILEHADIMLKPGGHIVYSTCTFSPEENEQVIAHFMQKFKHYDIVEICKVDEIEDGKPEWTNNDINLLKSARIWPHKAKGEGHFTVILKKKELGNSGMLPHNSSKYDYGLWGCTKNIKDNVNNMKRFEEFVAENLLNEIDGNFQWVGNNLYCLPRTIPKLDLNGIKTSKFGWYLGNVLYEKFNPSQSMCLALRKDDVKNSVNFDSHSLQLYKYLKGETLTIEGDNLYNHLSVKSGKSSKTETLIGICVDEHLVGWGKWSDIRIKNLYPKGWRLT